jgi:hypothetical protein
MKRSIDSVAPVGKVVSVRGAAIDVSFVNKLSRYETVADAARTRSR